MSHRPYIFNMSINSLFLIILVYQNFKWMFITLWRNKFFKKWSISSKVIEVVWSFYFYFQTIWHIYKLNLSLMYNFCPCFFSKYTFCAHFLSIFIPRQRLYQFTFRFKSSDSIFILLGITPNVNYYKVNLSRGKYCLIHF